MSILSRGLSGLEKLILFFILFFVVEPSSPSMGQPMPMAAAAAAVVSSSGVAIATAAVTGGTREGTGITTPESDFRGTGLATPGIESSILIAPVLRKLPRDDSPGCNPAESGTPARRLYALKHEHSEFTGQRTAIPVAMRASAAWAVQLYGQPSPESYIGLEKTWAAPACTSSQC